MKKLIFSGLTPGSISFFRKLPVVHIIGKHSRDEVYFLPSSRSSCVCIGRVSESIPKLLHVAAITQDASQGENEVASQKIGEFVIEELRKLDDVAYVRFASVYKNFREARDFETVLGEISGVRDNPDAASDLPAKPKRDAMPPGLGNDERT
jgi:hypothetical protein